jgi:putative transcriptional regulator
MARRRATSGSRAATKGTNATSRRRTAQSTGTKYKGEVFEALHRSASALHRVGAMSAQTMRTFDVTCIEPPGVWTKTRVRALRERHNMSQPVFAAYLNSTPSTVAQWESGAKRPSKIAAKLLQVLAKHGPEVLR